MLRMGIFPPLILSLLSRIRTLPYKILSHISRNLQFNECEGETQGYLSDLLAALTYENPRLKTEQNIVNSPFQKVRVMPLATSKRNRARN